MGRTTERRSPRCWNCGDNVEGRALLTPREAARLCRVSGDTLARWMESHRVDWIVTPSGRRRIFRDSLLDLPVR